MITKAVICRLDYEQFLVWYCSVPGDCGRRVVKVLCYKLEGRLFDPI